MGPDFKATMKHNSSNHSIQSTKKMIATIRKPTDFLGAGYAAQQQQHAGPSALMGQSNQLHLSGKKPHHHHHGPHHGSGAHPQNSTTSNYTSPYAQKQTNNAHHNNSVSNSGGAPPTITNKNIL